MNAPVKEKISAVCGHCGARYLVEAGWAGRQLMCSQCRAVFVVPQPPPPAGQPASPGGLGPGQPASPGGPGLGSPQNTGQVDPAHQWASAGMLQVRCLHCGTVIPLSRSFIGRYLACTTCQERFIVGPDGTALPPEPPFHRQLLTAVSNKRFLTAAAAAAAVLIVLAGVNWFVTHQRESQLRRALIAVYPPPNYKIATVKAPKNDKTVHKIADGSRECPAVAFVQVDHEPTSMRFNRTLCKVDGEWRPTFRQRIADQVAAESINTFDGSGRGFDIGAYVLSAYNSNAATVGGLYQTAEVPEEQLVAREFGSALDAMIRTGPEPESAPEPADESPMFSFDGDDEDFDYDFSFDYNASMAAYQERFYVAHSVMYPDQAAELFQAGKIPEMP